ncbi:hypothetical protein C0J52_03843, partial [Blattella germanica]
LLLLSWFYSPSWALTSLKTLFHSSLLLAFSFQFKIPNSLTSVITLSIHLCLGLPLVLVPSGIPLCIIFTLLLLSILTTCPNHLNLVNLTYVSKFISLYSSYNSLLYLILQLSPCLTAPKILLNTFRSNTSNLALTLLISAPYVTIGLISVLYIFNLVFLAIILLLIIGKSA